ncbi:MAG: hypothetical protein ACRDJL_00460, partial [Actinomycetota bacterium]
MQTLKAGTRAVLERPIAALPLTIEGLIFAGLMLLGFLPAAGGVAPAAAIFPFELYFDLKRAIAFSSSWPTFGITVAALVVFRSAVLAVMASLADGRRASPATLRNALMLGMSGAVFLFPAATLYFIAVAIRYAPFAWGAAALGLVAAWRLCRRGVALDTGAGAPGAPVPEFSSFFLYGSALMGLGAAIAMLAGRSVALAALLLACTGPLHATVWLGWRRRAREGATASEGRAVTTLACLLVAGFFVASTIDRNLREYDVVPADYEGTLLLLGGADSTSRRGALA